MICLLYTKNYARDTEINKMWQLHFVSPTSVEKDRCTMSTQYFCPSGKLQNSPLVYQINVQCVSPRQSDGFSCHHHRDSLKEHAEASEHLPKSEFPKTLFHISSKHR